MMKVKIDKILDGIQEEELEKTGLTREELIKNLAKIVNGIIEKMETDNTKFSVMKMQYAADVGYVTINNFLRGKSSIFKPETLVKIFAALGIKIKIECAWSYKIEA